MDINTCFATTAEVRNLALYAHLVPAIASAILGWSVIRHAVDRKRAWLFVGFLFTFALWLIGDVIAWTNNDYFNVALFWAPLDYINIAFFLLAFYFFYRDVTPFKTPRWIQALIFLAAIPPLVITFMGNSTFEFYHPACEALENPFITNYKAIVEWIVLAGIFLLGIRRIFAAKGNRREQLRVGMIGGAMIFFLGIFSSTEFIATITDVYEINLYALFVLPIFMLILTFSITSFDTFKIGNASMNVLFYIFITLAGAELFFVDNFISFGITIITFFVTLAFGVLLIKSFEREAKAKQEIEKLAHDLDIANRQQVTLIHFITHQVKGFLTKSRNIFSLMREGELGELPEHVQKYAEEGFKSDTKGVETVQNILQASDLKKGDVTYIMMPFSVSELVSDIAHDLKSQAIDKGLEYKVHAGGDIEITADKVQLTNAIKNLIENSIKYTQKGSVEVSLSQDEDIITFKVEDTGVGITEEDMQNLFTEGGHGKNSRKINVESTGFGLYIVKNIVEAHGGRVWAESEGVDKGSRFTIELPKVAEVQSKD